MSLAVDAGRGVVVEAFQGGRGGQAGEAQPAGEAAGFGGGHLEAEQPFECGGQRQPFGGGGVQHGREVFGGVVQFERGEMATQLLIERGLRRWWTACCRWSLQGVPSSRGGGIARQVDDDRVSGRAGAGQGGGGGLGGLAGWDAVLAAVRLLRCWPRPSRWCSGR